MNWDRKIIFIRTKKQTFKYFINKRLPYRQFWNLCKMCFKSNTFPHLRVRGMRWWWPPVAISAGGRSGHWSEVTTTLASPALPYVSPELVFWKNAFLMSHVASTEEFLYLDPSHQTLAHSTLHWMTRAALKFKFPRVHFLLIKRSREADCIQE